MDATLSSSASSAPRIFKIPVERLSLFQEKFAALCRRARKLGCPEPTCDVGEVAAEKRVEQDLDGEDFVTWVEYHPVTVTGAAPRYNGWIFLAVADYEAESPIFRKTPAGAEHEIPERYRSMGPVCEHCQLARGRRETFIVRHEGGDVKQVGRQCLRDFLGHDTPENVAAAAEFEADVLGMCEGFGGGDEGFGFGGPFIPSIDGYLAWVCRSVRLWGWLSRSQAHEDGFGRLSTATQAAMAMEKHAKALREGRGNRADRPTDADVVRAAAVLAWARSLGQDGAKLSDYEYNLLAAATLERVSNKHQGLVASAVASFDRDQARRRAVKQEHVGKVGDRLRGVRVFVDRVFALEYDGYGRSIVTLRDPEGHVFKWVTAQVPSTGKEYEMMATVKEHGDYKGTFQTVVTRAELQADDEPTKAECRRAEALAFLLAECEQTLSQRFGWEGEARKTIFQRRREATEAVNITELEALRVELHTLAGVIEPREEQSSGDLALVRRFVQARLAAAAPDRPVRKLKPADKARAHQIMENIRAAAEKMASHDYDARLFVTIAEVQADDIAALTALRTEVRAFVEGIQKPPYDNDYWRNKLAEDKATALALLDAEILVVTGANPAAAARLAKGLRKALAILPCAPFYWDGHEAFRSRVHVAEAACDVVTLEVLRAELVQVATVILPAEGTPWLTEHVEKRREEVLSHITPKVKEGKKVAATAPTA